MDKDELVASVEAQIVEWKTDAYEFGWNCGPTGRSRGQQIDYSAFPEVSKADFDAAVKDLMEYVKINIPGHSSRCAASGSGTLAGYNVWSFLIEPWGSGKARKFNYHVRVGR